MRIAPRFAIIVTTVFASTVAFAYPPGPEWGEDNDAGNSPGSAQIPSGSGTLGFINGTLGGMISPGGVIDFEDMYLINIVDTELFRITTDEDDAKLGGAFAKFDTQLWLFRIDAGSGQVFGMLGNNNAPDTGSFQSLLTPIPDDGQPPLVQTGLYYLAITRFNNVPLSGGGEIFNLASPTEISGPDGPGGMLPFASWSGDEGMFDGNYRMALRGVEFVPAPGALGLLAIAGLGARKRRRR